MDTVSYTMQDFCADLMIFDPNNPEGVECRFDDGSEVQVRLGLELCSNQQPVPDWISPMGLTSLDKHTSSVTFGHAEVGAPQLHPFSLLLVQQGPGPAISIAQGF